MDKEERSVPFSTVPSDTLMDLNPDLDHRVWNVESLCGPHRVPAPSVFGPRLPRHRLLRNISPGPRCNEPSPSGSIPPVSEDDLTKSDLLRMIKKQDKIIASLQERVTRLEAFIGV